MSALEKSVKGPVNLTISGFLWDDQDQWCKITNIIEQQMDGFVGSFDVLWSEWSQITDPDPHHPHGMHLR